ncbi:hypothetical protein H0B56_16355 [Haloechinothrix sp. YIM 98757]|uniref:Cupredoxin-like domain-containing protein n=1 Tax=Haloechinothrix aidingensis TaxID=2752311 RepID=A0A838AD27_9PSEU|nr:hypothetical protein [Haloechinothrix aidingensis]MBA0127123.1 hypothetical protein [Haloechinothrix aidingensis]
MTERLLAFVVAGTAVLAVAACSGDDDAGGRDGAEDASPSATVTRGGDEETTAQEPGGDGELLEFEISDGQVRPSVSRVSVEHGASVRIEVTSDQPDSVHLHGYDLETAVGPDEDGVLEFDADQAGRFELETHDTGLVLAQLLVR